MSTTRPAPHSTGHIVDDETVGIPSFEASGGDWSDIAEEAARLGEERIVVNMGPQHPSTHGVLRLMLEIDGETVTEARAASATCTPASRRTWSSAPGRRA